MTDTKQPFKDINGKPLYEGDLVVHSQMGHASLRMGRIEKFTEKRITVNGRSVEPSYCAKIPKKQEVIIPADRFDELLDDSLKLNYLRNHGVDNWDGYGDAMEEFHNSQEGVE